MQYPFRHLLDWHLLLLAQTAPAPPQTDVPFEPAGQAVLSVQSAVVLQKPPREFSKHFPPLHFPDRHWLSAVQVVPGQEARHRLVVGLQLPLWHWVSAPQTAMTLP